MYSGNASIDEYLKILNNITYAYIGENFAVTQR